MRPISRPGKKSEIKSVMPLIDAIFSNSLNSDLSSKIEKVNRGTNHDVYRIHCETGQYAVKIPKKNQANGIERCFSALWILHRNHLVLAPRPIMIEFEQYRLPFMVMSWENGDQFHQPPLEEAAWKMILEHYLKIHQVKPFRTLFHIRKALFNATSADDCRKFVFGQIDRVPKQEWSDEIISLIDLWNRNLSFQWKNIPRVLCRGDANFKNFIIPSQGIVSVDWENGGWGDAAFDIASLLAHPAYVTVPFSHLNWAAEYYSQHSNDPGMLERIIKYLPTITVFWAARYANLLYHMRPNRNYPWEDRRSLREDNYKYYINLSNKLLS